MANGEKARLTDAQKKANHIESERKRREAIRRAFDALSDVVPGMKGQARSEAVMLQATVSHLSELLHAKEKLRQIVCAQGLSEEDFESFYEEHLQENEAVDPDGSPEPFEQSFNTGGGDVRAGSSSNQDRYAARDGANTNNPRTGRLDSGKGKGKMV